MYEEVCTIPNELIVMTNAGRDRSDVEGAAALSGGQVVFEVEGPGIYTVRLPVAGPADLAPLKAAFESAGFSVAYSYMTELFAGR